MGHTLNTVLWYIAASECFGGWLFHCLVADEDVLEFGEVNGVERIFAAARTVCTYLCHSHCTETACRLRQQKYTTGLTPGSRLRCASTTGLLCGHAVASMQSWTFGSSPSVGGNLCIPSTMSGRGAHISLLSYFILLWDEGMKPQKWDSGNDVVSGPITALRFSVRSPLSRRIVKKNWEVHVRPRRGALRGFATTQRALHVCVCP